MVPAEFWLYETVEDKANKKYYDPRKWLRAGQETLVERTVEAFKDLNAMDRN